MLRKFLLGLLATGGIVGTGSVVYVLTREKTKSFEGATDTDLKVLNTRNLKWNIKTTSDMSSISVTVTDSGWSWSCKIMWLFPTGVNSFQLIDSGGMSSKMNTFKSKLEGKDEEARKNFVKNCSLSGSKDGQMTNGSSSEIFLETEADTKGKYWPKNLDEFLTHEVKGLNKFNVSDLGVISDPRNWVVELEDKTLHIKKSDWSCSIEAEKGTLNEELKNKFQNDVFTSSNTSVGNKRQFQLRNCLINDKKIKITKDQDSDWTFEEITKILLENIYRNSETTK